VFCLPQVYTAFPNKSKGFSAHSNPSIVHPEQKGAESEKEFFSSLSRAPTFNPAPELGLFYHFFIRGSNMKKVFCFLGVKRLF
jgi:hypothetical protein